MNSFSSHFLKTQNSPADAGFARFVRGAFRFFIPVIPSAFLFGLLLYSGVKSYTILFTIFVATYGVVVTFWEKILWHRRQGLRPFHSLVRYFPVLDVLDFWRPLLPGLPTILEVGSGTIGLGNLIEGPFTGCDVSFEGPTSINMRPVVGSAAQLPFHDAQFDFVISVDTLEHIPTREDREKALKDMWRVCRKALLIGYPCGAEALKADAKLADHYRKRGEAIPGWLEEHLANGLPEENLLSDCLKGQATITAWRSESVASHLWMMMRDTDPGWSFLFSFLQAGFPLVLRKLIRLVSSSTQTPYRRFYVLRRDTALPEPLK